MFRLGRFLIYKINPETALAAKFKVINKKRCLMSGKYAPNEPVSFHYLDRRGILFME